MIRNLHPIDSPAFLPFKLAAGKARAYPLPLVLTGQANSFPLVKYAGVAVSPGAWRSCWVQTQRTRIQVLMRAGQRSGRLAWEVRDLYVHEKFGGAASEALEQLAVPAGKSGARRVFLRMSSDDLLTDEARKAGFVPVDSETLYSVESAADASERLGDFDGNLGLRAREPIDDETLFRLYCATTPVDIRMRTSQTMPEWRDSFEKPGRKAREWVAFEGDGKVCGWLRTARTGSGHFFEIAWSGETRNAMQRVLSAGLDTEDGPVSTLVPSRKNELAELLVDIGFRPLRTYTSMVKTLTVRVPETRRVAAVAG